MSEDFLTDVMGLDPTNLNVFNEQNDSNSQSIFYKPNPNISKSEDGHYRASLRIIYNPHDLKESIVKSLRYNCKDEDGFFSVSTSLINGDKSCPIFKAWKQLWFSKTDTDVKREWAKKMFDRSECQWVIVQIISDNNQPELVGQFKIMKLPRTVFNRLISKMNPSPESKKQPVKVMDWIFGLELEMDVIPGPSDTPYRISYDSCDFQGVMPIINVDGTQLFTDEELELIDSYAQHNTNFINAKTENTRKKERDILDTLSPQIRSLYEKASKVVIENAPNLVEECGYKPWTDEESERVNKWLKKVLNMQNPEVCDLNEIVGNINNIPKETEVINKQTTNSKEDIEFTDDDLPF